MNGKAILEQVTSDGYGKAFRTGDGDEGPRPIDDNEVAAIAGDADYRVSFSDGCTVNVYGVYNALVASAVAVDHHRTLTSHTNHDHIAELL